MFGGFKNGIKKNSDFFKEIEISPIRSGLAVDLGAGCGFQSIPLDEAGFSVVAIDLARKLLNEMKKMQEKNMKIVQDDLLESTLNNGIVTIITNK